MEASGLAPAPLPDLHRRPRPQRPLASLAPLTPFQTLSANSEAGGSGLPLVPKITGLGSPLTPIRPITCNSGNRILPLAPITPRDRLRCSRPVRAVASPTTTRPRALIDLGPGEIDALYEVQQNSPATPNNAYLCALVNLAVSAMPEFCGRASGLSLAASQSIARACASSQQVRAKLLAKKDSLGPAISAAVGETLRVHALGCVRAVIGKAVGPISAFAALRPLHQRLVHALAGVRILESALIDNQGSTTGNAPQPRERALVLASVASQVREVGPGAILIAEAAERELALTIEKLLTGDSNAASEIGFLEYNPDRLLWTLNREKLPACISLISGEAILTCANLQKWLPPIFSKADTQSGKRLYSQISLSSMKELPNLTKTCLELGGADAVDRELSLATQLSLTCERALELERVFWKTASMPGQLLAWINMLFQVGLLMDGPFLCDLLDAITTNEPAQASLVLSERLARDGLANMAYYIQESQTYRLYIRDPPLSILSFIGPLVAVVVGANQVILSLCLHARTHSKERNMTELIATNQQLEQIRSQVLAAEFAAQTAVAAEQPRPTELLSRLDAVAGMIAIAISNANRSSGI